MKRLLFLIAVAALALPAAANAKGPSEATITGPGLGKAIKITGPESDGSPMMNLAEVAGLFPAGTLNAPCTLRRLAFAEGILPWLGVARVRTSTRASTGFPVRR